MQNLLNIAKKEIFPISLVLILALARLIPHPPNFTPVIAVAIMSSYFFKNIYLSFTILLISMLLADVFIGFYENMLFVYASLFLITFVFFKLNNKINFKSLLVFGLAGSLIFYFISNFGVWLVNGMYEKNLNGLIHCYFMAVPFFKNTVLSTIFFTYIAFLTNSFYKKKFVY